MKLFLLFLSCVCIFTATAQKPEADPAPKSKKIKFPKYPLADFPKKTMPLSEIKILQFLPDSVCLGYVQKGLDNQITMLVTPKPLTAFLQEHIEKMYGNDYKKAGAKMLWVLKNLRISEKSALLEYAYMRFDADAYILPAGETAYRLVNSMDTVFFSESGVDVTAWHGERLEDAMRLLLMESLKNAPEKIKSAGTFTFEEIARDATPKLDFPILREDSFAEGGYASFSEFLENKPSVQGFETVPVSKSEVIFLKPNTAGGKDTLGLWGISKKGELYKYYDGQLVPVERSGNSFIISDFIEKHNRRNSNIFMSSIVGGVAGGLIAGSAKRNRPYLVTNISHISKPKKQPEASVIDIKTGEFSF